jgi:hypothetical protein
MTWCRYHCRRCGSHFASLEAFDANHGGSGEGLEPCTFPDDAHLLETAGTCVIGDPANVATGTVYSTERANRAADYFRPTNGRQTAWARRRDPLVGVVGTD